jgi:putative acetyltransferase
MLIRAKRTPGAIGIGLGPVGVLPAHCRRGIAAELIKRGLADCASAGFRWAVVLGEPAYYSRFGFRPASEFGLGDEYEGGNYFQALELVLGDLTGRAGLVKYAPEFSMVT